MSKVAVIEILSEVLNQPIEVCLKIWDNWDDYCSEISPLSEIKGLLPADFGLEGLYILWYSQYKNLQPNSDLLQNTRSNEEDLGDFDFGEGQPTNISTRYEAIEECRQALQNLEICMKTWLQSPDSNWQVIRDCLLEQLQQSSEDIRLIIQTPDSLWKYPWQVLDLLDNYPHLELILTPANLQQSDEKLIRKNRSKVRILAVFCEDEQINLQGEIAEIKQLEQLYNAEIEILSQTAINPDTNKTGFSATEFTQKLKDEQGQGWDIFLFSGHSKTVEGRGEIQISKNEKIGIHDFKNTLRQTIVDGLKVMIFNSCQGLGLVWDLAQVGINLPVSIVMREPIQDRVAEDFLKHLMSSYANGESLEHSVSKAKNELKHWDEQFPGSSQLPIIATTSKQEIPLWRDLINPEVITTNSEINIPFSKSISSATTCFVGRENELEQLHEKLSLKNEFKILAITGMGGVGKTELVTQYALNHKTDYLGGISWIFASGDNTNIGSDLVNFARQKLQLSPSENISLEQQVIYCYENWIEGQVLIIIDNVDNFANIQAFLPPDNSKFKVVITSRQFLTDTIEHFELDILSESASLQLLDREVSSGTNGKDRVKDDQETAKEICAKLGYLPLGLELVGRYLVKEKNLSLPEYLQILAKETLNQESLEKPPVEMTAPHGVKGAFELSWKLLNSEAKHFACLLSLFASAPIQWELIIKVASDYGLENLEEIRQQTFINLHLLQQKGESIYQLHPLIREFFNLKLGDISQQKLIKESLIKVLVKESEQIDRYPSSELVIKVSPIIPHIEQITEYLIKETKSYLNEDEVMSIFYKLANYYEHQSYSQAEYWLKQGLLAITNHFGDNSISLATIYEYLGIMIKYQGRYKEALEMYRRSLTIDILGENHKHVATVKNNIGVLYEDIGKYKLGEKYLNDALKLRQKLLNDNNGIDKATKDELNLDIAESYNNLAQFYDVNQGMYAKAKDLYDKCLEIREIQLGKHQLVAQTYSNLGNYYTRQKLYDNALDCHFKALKMRIDILGEDHLETSFSYNNLASIYIDNGNYSDAKNYLDKALLIRQKVYGDNTINVATILHNIGMNYLYQQQYPDAEEYLTKALHIKQNLLGNNHPDVGLSFVNLGGLKRQEGKYKEAKEFYLKGITIFDQKSFKGYMVLRGKKSFINFLTIIHQEEPTILEEIKQNPSPLIQSIFNEFMLNLDNR